MSLNSAPNMVNRIKIRVASAPVLAASPSHSNTERYDGYFIKIYSSPFEGFESNTRT